VVMKAVIVDVIVVVVEVDVVRCLEAMAVITKTSQSILRRITTVEHCI
jgi:hypothetical protein